MTDNRDLRLVQHLCCKNDVNGNPRRVFVGYDDGGNVIQVEDEGYAGRPAWAREVPELPSMTITPTEYRAWLKREEKGRTVKPSARGSDAWLARQRGIWSPIVTALHRKDIQP